MNYTIIGGGIAGMTTAYLLSKYGDPNNKITLIEKRDKLGGLVDDGYKSTTGLFYEHSPRVILGDYYNFFNLMNEINPGESLVELDNTIIRKDKSHHGPLTAFLFGMSIRSIINVSILVLFGLFACNKRVFNFK